MFSSRPYPTSCVCQYIHLIMIQLSSQRMIGFLKCLFLSNVVLPPSSLSRVDLSAGRSVWERTRRTLEWTEKITQQTCRDESHNHIHSQEVLYWSTRVIRALPAPISEREADIVFQTSLLHDFMDSKYPKHMTEIAQHWEELGYPIEIQEVIFDIMNTMSYSKVFYPDSGKVIFPQWLEQSPYARAFHITREADLLASYNIARMIIYGRVKNPSWSNEVLCQSVHDLFEKRMRRLLENNLFYFESTTALALTLSKVAEIKLSLVTPRTCAMQNLDIFKIVHYLEQELLRDAVHSCLDASNETAS